MSTKTITSEDGNKYRLKYEIDANEITIIGVSPKDVKEVVIPSEINGVPVTKIGNCAFYGCTNLTSITIPDSVTSIGDYAFYCCPGLTSITIPDSVTSISNGAFYRCTELTSIIIPDSVTSIGSNAFSGCPKLTSITIPNSVTSIGSEAFYGCTGLTSVYAPSVQYIDEWAFGYCVSLRNIELAPDACWENNAFKNSGLEDEYYYNEEER